MYDEQAMANWENLFAEWWNAYYAVEYPALAEQWGIAVHELVAREPGALTLDEVPSHMSMCLARQAAWSKELPAAWGEELRSFAAHALYAFMELPWGEEMARTIYGLTQAVARAEDQEDLSLRWQHLDKKAGEFLYCLSSTMLDSAILLHRERDQTIGKMERQSRDGKLQLELDEHNVWRVRALSEERCVFAVIEYAAAVQIFIGWKDSLDGIPPAAPMKAYAHLTAGIKRPITVHGLDPSYRDIVRDQLLDLVSRGGGRKHVLFADEPAERKRRPTAKVRFAKTIEEHQDFWKHLGNLNGEKVDVAHKPLDFRVFHNEQQQKAIFIDPEPEPGYLESFGFVVIGSGWLEKYSRGKYRSPEVLVTPVDGIGRDELQDLLKRYGTHLRTRFVESEAEKRPKRRTFVRPTDEAATGVAADAVAVAEEEGAAAGTVVISSSSVAEEDDATTRYAVRAGEVREESGPGDIEPKKKDLWRRSVRDIFPEIDRLDAQEQLAKVAERNALHVKNAGRNPGPQADGADADAGASSSSAHPAPDA